MAVGRVVARAAPCATLPPPTTPPSPRPALHFSRRRCRAPLPPHPQAANVDATLRQLRAGGAPAAAIAAASPAAAKPPAAKPAPRVKVGAAAQAAAAAEVERQLQLAAELEQLFDDPQHRPDLEAGGLAAIHAPPGSGLAGGRTLLRLRLQPGGKGAPPLQRLLLVPTAAAEALADAPTSEARLALLDSLPDLRCASAQAKEVPALAAAVRRQRRQQPPPPPL